MNCENINYSETLTMKDNISIHFYSLYFLYSFVSINFCKKLY